MTFEGEVDETLGTHLMFEIEERKVETTGLLPLLSSIRGGNNDEGENSSSNNNYEGGALSSKPQKYTLKYDCSTENIIKMDTVNIKPKEQPEPQQEEQNQKDDGSTLEALF
jgi:hypothetical protein